MLLANQNDMSCVNSWEHLLFWVALLVSGTGEAIVSDFIPDRGSDGS